MLKSELVISEDMELLNSHLKHYSIRFLHPLFSDDKGSNIEGYKEERTRIVSMAISNDLKQHTEVRNFLIPQMLRERDLFIRIRDIITRNKEWDVDPIIIVNTLKQMETLGKAMEECCVAKRLTEELINEYYDESLLLLVHFTALRSYIATIRRLRNKFQPKNTACVFKFSHTEETSLSIIQQKQIINFVAMIFSSFFEEYLDIIVIELDTGSPKLDIPIRINHDTKVNWDVSRSFSDFFMYMDEGDKAHSIRALKKISKQLNQNQDADIKQLKAIKNNLTQEEYNKRIVAIFDAYSELRKNQIAVAVDNTSIVKRLGSAAPLLIEDSNASLSEDAAPLLIEDSSTQPPETT
jgi:hypothetical protein